MQILRNVDFLETFKGRGRFLSMASARRFGKCVWTSNGVGTG